MNFRMRYHVVFFIVNLIILSPQALCVDKEIILKKMEKLSSEEKKDLTNFFRICFHSYEFGYTIFGEKPMSLDAMHLEISRPPIDDLVDYKEDEWALCSYRKKEGWDVWKKHFQDIQLKGFSFIFYSAQNQPGIIHFAIINHKTFLKVIENNLSEFQKVLQKKIEPNEILSEYVKCEKEVFEIIKNHDGLLGILLGYGKENSWKFMNGEKLSPSVDPLSLKNEDMSNIFLPLFMVSEGSAETQNIMTSYRKQREKINDLYQKENFLEMVLLKLFCSE